MDRPSNKVIFSLYDSWAAIKRASYYFLFAAFFCGILLFSLQIQKPLTYTAEGLYKSSSSNSIGRLPQGFEALVNLKSDFIAGGEDCRGYLLTPPVLQFTVRQIGAQGYIALPQKGGRLRRIFQRIKLENALNHYAKKNRPSSSILSSKVVVLPQLLFPDPPSYLELTDIAYEGEIYSHFTVHFKDDDHFFIIDKKGNKLGNGVVDEPFRWELGSFTLRKNKAPSLRNKEFKITWIPMDAAISSLEKGIQIKKDKINPSLIHISYTHRNRHLAAKVVNGVMDGYQQFTKEEGKRKISNQLEYLSTRQAETQSRFEESLDGYRQTIAQCVGEGHFLSLEQELLHVSQSQAQLKSLLAIAKNEIARLASISEAEVDAYVEQMQSKSLSNTLLPTELQTLPLKEALGLFTQSQLAFEKLGLAQQKYKDFISMLNRDEADLASFTAAFVDTTLQNLFEEINALNCKLLDAENWTPKEKERIKRELDTRKQFLLFHLQHLDEGCSVELETLSSKIESLRSLCLQLLLNDYRAIQMQLQEIAQSSITFAEKWLAEKKINLSNELHASIVETITKMVEATNIRYHTDYIESLPFSYARSPTLPHSAHLFIYFLIGCGLGAGVTLVVVLLNEIRKGASASEKNMKALGYQTLATISNPLDPSWAYLSAMALSQHKTKSSIVLCASKQDFLLIDALLETLSLRKEKMLLISFTPTDEDGLLTFLTNGQMPLPIQVGKTYDFLPAGPLSMGKEMLFTSGAFSTLLDELKTRYEWIFFLAKCEPTSLLITSLLPHVDQCLYLASLERVDELAKLPTNTFYLFQQEGRSPLSFPLSHIEPLLQKVKNKVYSSHLFLQKHIVEKPKF